MIVYGTPQQLAEWVDPDTTPPEAVPRATVLLRSASQTVLDYTAGAVYATDPDGKAKDPAVLKCLTEATLEQAAALHINGIDPRKGAGGIKRRVSSKKLDSATLTYLADARADSFATDLASGALVRTAWLALRSCGLITSQVQTRDYGDLGANAGYSTRAAR